MSCSACKTEREHNEFCMRPLVIDGAFHSPECPRHDAREFAKWMEDWTIRCEDERPGGIGEQGL
jgi:hypothetical protein